MTGFLNWMRRDAPAVWLSVFAVSAAALIIPLSFMAVFAWLDAVAVDESGLLLFAPALIALCACVLAYQERGSGE